MVQALKPGLKGCGLEVAAQFPPQRRIGAGTPAGSGRDVIQDFAGLFFSIPIVRRGRGIFCKQRRGKYGLWPVGGWGIPGLKIETWSTRRFVPYCPPIGCNPSTTLPARLTVSNPRGNHTGAMQEGGMYICNSSFLKEDGFCVRVCRLLRGRGVDRLAGQAGLMPG